MIALLACAGAGLFLIIGQLAPPPEVSSAKAALVRIALTATATTVFTLGPGLALVRAFGWSPRVGVGALPIPGFVCLALVGLAAWLLSHLIPPVTTARTLLWLLTLGLAVAAAWPGERTGLRLDRSAALVLVLLTLVVIGRDLYYFGPPGEFYGGTVSRTYEASNRPDSRISYYVVQVIDHGINPLSKQGERYFWPYWFGARGPISGIMSAPVVLGSGADVPVTQPNEAWQPFDREGYAAYRLAMEIFAIVSLLSVFGVVASLVGRDQGLFALVLVASTPFVVHEVYFTWPKLLTGALVILAGHQLLVRRFVRGAADTGLAYLAHPVALLSVPSLALLCAIVGWRKERRVARPIVTAGLYVAVVAAVMGGWLALNHSGPSQLSFITYVTGANAVPATSLGIWVQARGQSLADTFIPMYLFVFHRYDPNANPVLIPIGSPLSVFFIQYWTSFPFASGILFFPLLLWGLWRALRRAPLTVATVVLFPLLTFTIYWGSYDTGMMREGLQPWMLTVLAAYAWARGAVGWRLPIERWLLLSRLPETVLMMILAGVLTHHRIISGAFPDTDRAALLAMALGFGGLGVMIWRATGKRALQGPTEAADRRTPTGGVVTAPT